MTVEEAGDYSLDIDYSRDGFTWADLGEVDLSPVGTIFPFEFPAYLGDTDIKKDRLYFAKLTSYFLQLRFRQSGLDEECSIRGWELLYKQRSLRDA
jgi:hypothetical protein